MTDHAIVAKNNGSKSLQAYGAKDEVREMAGRILAMLPNAKKLSDNERLGLAQLAVAHGLNPFNGEVWALPGIGLMIGIKGLRKKAHEQVSGNFWIDYREITDPDERKRWRITEGALAFEARLYDSENIRTYTETIKTLMDAHIPWESVEKMVGTRPYTSGIGVLKAGEQTKMEPVQCARKRAESNALKQRFDVPFGVSVDEGDAPADVMTADYHEVETQTPYPDNAAADAEIVAMEEKRAAMFGNE